MDESLVQQLLRILLERNASPRRPLAARNSRDTIRNNRPDALFRYMSLDVGKLVLTQKSLRWSSPLLFNDPFDLPREVRFPFSTDDWEDLLQEVFSGIVEHDWKLDQLKKIAVAWMEEFKASIQASWLELLPRYRILCFSTRPDIPLMWSHYAEGHCGVVIGFETQRRIGSDWTGDPVEECWADVAPVEYCETLPLVNALRQYFSPWRRSDLNIWQQLEYFKSMEWSHEQEWRAVRVLSNSNGSSLMSDWSFPPEAVGAIYLGYRVTKDDLQEFIDLRSNLPDTTIPIYVGKLEEKFRRIGFDLLETK